MNEEPTGDAVNIEGVSDGKRIEIPLTTFYRMMLNRLRRSDEVNNEIELDGRAFIISSLKLGVIKPKEEEKKKEKAEKVGVVMPVEEEKK